jgi:hypothetical protein
LKPEQWASPVVQEKYEEEKVCDKRQQQKQQQQYKQYIMQHIYHKQKETANADYVNNMKRNISQVSACAICAGKEQYIHRHDTACATICKEIRVKFDKEHR